MPCSHAARYPMRHGIRCGMKWDCLHDAHALVREQDAKQRIPVCVQRRRGHVASCLTCCMLLVASCFTRRMPHVAVREAALPVCERMRPSRAVCCPVYFVQPVSLILIVIIIVVILLRAQAIVALKVSSAGPRGADVLVSASVDKSVRIWSMPTSVRSVRGAAQRLLLSSESAAVLCAPARVRVASPTLQRCTLASVAREYSCGG
jgi:hypothetical protein